MNTSNVSVFVIFAFTFLGNQSWQTLQKNESLINIAQSTHESKDVSNVGELCQDHLSVNKWLALLGFFCHPILYLLILQESYDDCQLCKCHHLWPKLMDTNNKK